MVLITQSDSNEDIQSRQLHVSKKLSKAISSVPRSRFMKPRPNLPGSKRAHSSNVPVTAHKSIEKSQNDSAIKNLNTDESSEIDGNSLKNCENLNTDETSGIDNTIIKSSEILDPDDTSQNNTTLKSSKIIDADEASQNDNSLKNYKNIKTDESSQNNASAVIILENINTNETSQKDSSNLKHAESVYTNETSQNDSLYKNCENINTDETLENDSNASKCSETLKTESILDPPVEERNDSQLNTPPSATDKSFKYPHLTSILSKKRTEPKKEVQHKKRKKFFKKGEVAPERSKMTMADLIYWNPTNTNQLPKNDATEEEILLNSNNDEPEAVCPVADSQIEENICDSVPKLVISEDGSINIDQSSLIVSRNVPEPTITQVIRKDDTTYSSFRRRPMTKHWTAKDTTIFYKALSLVGTDFGLMERIFPHRTRRELKLKFKREEKFNIDLINRAIYESQLTFDSETLEDLIESLNSACGDCDSENPQEDPQSSAKEKKKTVKRKRRTTKKETESVDTDLNDESIPNEAVNGREVITKRRRKVKKLPDNVIDPDEIEELVLLEAVISGENDAISEMNSNENTSEGNPSCENEVQSRLKTSIPRTDRMCETTNVEIIYLNEDANVKLNSELEASKTIFVTENARDLSQVIIQDNSSENVLQTTSFATHDEQEQCITLEYVEGPETNSTTMDNVMAYVEISSQKQIGKRKQKVNNTSNILNKDKLQESCHTFQFSSTNYTPVDSL